MNFEISSNKNINEIYEGLTNSLISCREQDLAAGVKRVIVESGDVNLTFDFISSNSGYSATDSITVKYTDSKGNSSCVINSLEQALQIVQDNVPEKLINSKKIR